MSEARLRTIREHFGYLTSAETHILAKECAQELPLEKRINLVFHMFDPSERQELAAWLEDPGDHVDEDGNALHI